MVNAEQTRDAAAVAAPDGGTPQPAEPTDSRATAASPPIVGNISIRPGREAIRQLPPGPRMPGAMQSLAIWTRRNAFFERCRARYGKRFTIRYRVPTEPYVVITDPEEVKQVFQAPGEIMWSANSSSELVKYFGDSGLSLSEEDRHLARRKVVNKSTHGQALEQIGASVDGVTDRELDTWPRDEVIALYPRVHRLTLKVIRHVCFGSEEDPRLDELVDVLTEMMRFNDNPLSLVETQYLSPRVMRLLSAVPPLGVRSFVECHARADALIYEMVADRRRRSGADDDARDLLSLLLATSNEDGSPLSPLELRDEIMTTFLAGTTTTASSIAAGVDLIIREPAVHERLIREIDAGDGEAYLTATVQEILRRKPPLPMVLPRLVMRPVEIGGITYLPGVRLWVNAHLVHHDADVYPDPYVFRPERFLDVAPGTYTWLPFGGGRRRCLGKPIAELEIKTVLRELFSRYEVRPEGPQPETTRSNIVTVRPARGTRVALSARS